MNKKTKYILFVVIVAMLVTPLFGCGPTQPSATPDAGVTDAVVSDAPATDATSAPSASAGDEVTPAPSADAAETPAPEVSGSVAPTQDAGTATAAPSSNTGTNATAKPNTGNTNTVTAKPNTGNTVTAKPNTATAKPNTGNKVTPAPTNNNSAEVSGPYKGVVLMGFNAIKMSPFAFRSNAGTQQEISWWHYPSVYDTTNAKSKRGTKYFTLVCSPAEKVKSDVFRAATAAGKFPVILDLGINSKGLANIKIAKGRAKNLDWSMPYVNNGTTTKIYFDLWMWDYDYKRPALGSSFAEVEKHLNERVCPDIKQIADAFKAKNPKVEVYVGGLHPYADSYPRADKTLYPENTYTYTDEQIPLEHEGAKPANLKAQNQVVKKFCDKNGYKFVDYFKCGLAGSNGWAKEEYMEAHGAMLNKDGLKIYADYLMDQMGLPKPVQDY